MKVNILMPVYNIKNEELEGTIKSVLNQTYSEFTFLIIDDYSTNDTLDILNDYEKLDNRIKIINSKGNKGIIGALNEGINNVDIECEYVVRIDCGDICLETRLEKQVEYMEQNLKCAALGTKFEVYSLEDNISDSIKRFKNYSNKICEFKDIKKNYTIMAMFVHSTLMLRKEVIDILGAYDHKYVAAEDYEIISRFITAGYEVNKIPEVLVKYEFTPDKGISQENRVTQTKNSLRIKTEFIFNNFIKNNIKRNIFIWGIKEFAGYLEEELRRPEYKVNVKAFTDFDSTTWGDIKNNLPIISPEEMINNLNKGDIIITMWNIDRENIVKFLEKFKLLRNRDYFVFS